MLRSFRDKLVRTRRIGQLRKPAATPSTRVARLAFESLEPRLVLSAGPLLIGEFLAANDNGLSDEDGDFPDWIEIHNPTDEAVDLDAWSLTDDATDLQQWQFPSLTIDAGGYQVVFASKKDRRDPLGELHTNFALDRGGEYLALVRPDGTTIADAYDPAYPRQTADISYGIARNDTLLLPSDTEWKVLVPTEANAQSAWPDPTFDDSSWQTGSAAAPVLITEAGHGSPDYVEIQNVTEETVVTDGWSVVLNEGTSGDIDRLHASTWNLPATMAPGEILYVTDLSTENYFGENILWGTNDKGWAMIVDGDGRPVDLAVWSYTEAAVAAMNVEINGSTIRGSDAWTGKAVPVTTDSSKTSMMRVGQTDHNDASDFVFVAAIPTNRGLPNPDLILPVDSAGLPGVGYSLHPSGFGGALQTNVASVMYEVNSSLWMRTTFDVADPTAYTSLTLRAKYNDGFVAYLNGQPIARRNAPDAPEWNAAATLARSIDESVVFEEINLIGPQEFLVEGSNVLAIHGLNVAADDDDFFFQAELLGIGAEQSHRYFADPTPGARNTESFLGFVADTTFSIDRGFYETPQQLEITTATPEASIYFTTDGSRPSETNGNLYIDPITIGTTAIIRAVAVKPGWRPTNIDTQTYIFPEDVIRQPANPTGFPTTWGPATADYEMDPDVVDDPLYRDIILDSLRTHPTISLVIDPVDLWDPDSGIYSNSTKDGPAWEREVSIELIDFPEADDLQVNAGVRMHGSASRNISRPKHNFRLVFRKEYGLGKLEYPLFGDTEVQRFNDLILRGGNGDSWFHPNKGRRPQAQYTHDQWHRDAQVSMGQPTAQQGDVHVYLNGLYWGFYHLIERPEASFMEEHFGGDKEDYDVLQHKNGTVNGNRNAWDAMMTMLRTSDLSTDEAYQRALQYVDPVNLADFMLLNFYSANTDWDHNNWYGARKRELGEGWKFFSWDSEVTFRNLSANITGVLKTNQPTEIHQRLSANAEYKMLFADRAQKHLFNGGTLTPQTVTDAWLTRGDEIDEALVAESARWGDHHRPSSPYTVENEFRARQTELVNSWFAVRTNILLGQLRARGMYPSVVAPSFEIDGNPRHGGLLEPDERIAMDAPAGTVYYTLDGTDPREPGGGILGEAIRYDGIPILLSNSGPIKSRVLYNGVWSALNEADFLLQRAAIAGDLVVTELNYNPHDPTPEELNVDPDFNNDDFEFIELQNVGSETIELAGVRFTDGVTLTIDGLNNLLAPGERAVVVNDQPAFEARYGTSVDVVGVYTGNLNNGGEQIAVLDRSGETILDFTYNDTNAWPGRADGNGSSLELLDPTGDFNDGNNWRSSSELGGSPGYEGIGPMREIVINEVLSHTDSDEVDAIELYNPTDEEIDIGGWYLSDSSSRYRKFRIPDDTVISAGGYHVFDESDFNPSGGGESELHPNDFALSGARGDDVWLLKADDADRLTHFADHVDFPAAAQGETLGRWPNGQDEFYPMSDNTLGRANTGPRVGPVIISELHYNPSSEANANDLEFIEIYNSTGLSIELTEWRLRGGIGFDFAAETTLDARSALVVVPFDPDSGADADRLTAFRIAYSIDESVRLVGPYSGKLDNGGENVQLQRPDHSPAEDPDFIPRLIEDEVRYDDAEPWPEGADGNGDSLYRSSVHLWGHSAASWTAAAPTPGSVDTGASFVVGRHIFYNNSAWDGHDEAANAQDDLAIATDKRALMPGTTATSANYASYASGINGIMVDIAGTVDAGLNAAEDFIFRLGNRDDTSDWSLAPQPLSIVVRPGAGVSVGAGGSDRVSIVWTDGAIERQWLEVTVLATERTGLAEADIFYFGNAIGEAGDNPINTIVNASDEIAARNFQHSALDPALIDDPYDYNRDRLVNGTDQIIARENQTNPLTMLRLIEAPAADAAITQFAEQEAADPEAADPEAADPEAADPKALSAALDWLVEYEEMNSKKASAEDDKAVEAAVDELLATDWQ